MRTEREIYATSAHPCLFNGETSHIAGIRSLLQLYEDCSDMSLHEIIDACARVGNPNPVSEKELREALNR